MQDIDFLPPQYREQNALRRTRVWQLGVASLFAMGIVLSAAGQLFLRQSIVSELSGIQDRHQVAMARANELNELDRQLQVSREAAALYTFLRFPWPTSQLLAEVVSPLPESIALVDLMIHQSEPKVGVRRSSNIATQPAEPKRTARQDLLALQQRFGDQPTTIIIEGRARDVAALHAYVAALAASKLIGSAKLDSLESNPAENDAMFSLRLVVVLGHGQQQGLSLAVAQ